MAANETEIGRMIVRLTGDSADYEAMIKRAEEATTQITSIEEQYAQARKQVDQITAQTRTTQERYNDKVGELNRLWEMGVIDQDTYNRAFKQYGDELPKVEAKVSAFTRAYKVSTDAIKAGIAGVKSSFTKLQGIASSTLGVFAGLGALGGLGAAFKDFTAVEKGWLHLKNAVEANGAAVDTTIARYKEFIAETERVSLATKLQIRGLLTQAAGYGIVGERAEQLTRNALALASATGKTTQETFMAAYGLQTHNNQMVKHGLGLRRMKDETKVMAIANSYLTSGFKSMAEEMNTPAVKIEKLKRSLAGLTFEVGAIVAEAITPFVDRLKELADWFNRLDPSVKKVVAVFLTALGVLVALGPVFAAVGTVVGGVIGFISTTFTVVSTAFGVLFALLGALFTPLGIVVAGLTAVLYATVDWAALGGAAVNWFAGIWDDLKKHFQPAIDGIVNALKAGNIKLAFEVLWAQVQLTFATGIKPLREMWGSFALYMEQLWIAVMATIKEDWLETSTWIQKKWIDIKEFFDLDEETTAEHNKQKADLDNQLNKALAANNKAMTDQIDKAAKESADGIKDIEKNLKDLEKERDRLVAKAGEEAANVKPLKDPTVKITAGYEKATKAAKELKGVLVGSAVDIREIIKYQERLSGTRDYASTNRSTGVQVGSSKDVQSLAKQDKANVLLQDIKDAIKGIPGAQFIPGGLGQ